MRKSDCTNYKWRKYLILFGCIVILVFTTASSSFAQSMDAAEPIFYINPEAWVIGYNWPAGESVTLTIYDESIIPTQIIYEDIQQVSAQGEIWFDLVGVDLYPGLTVKVDAQSISKEIPFQRVTFDYIDYETDIAWGTGPSEEGWSGVAFIRTNLWQSWVDVVFVDDGVWSADFGAVGRDLVFGEWLDWTGVDFIFGGNVIVIENTYPATPSVYVNTYPDRLFEYRFEGFSVESEMTYRLYDSKNMENVLDTGTFKISDSDNIAKATPIAPQPGMYFVAEDTTGRKKTLVFPAFTVDINNDSGVIIGTTDSGIEAGVLFINDQGDFFEHWDFPDEEGNWSVNFGNGVLSSEGDLEVVIIDWEGDFYTTLRLPVADAGGPYSVLEGEYFTLDASSSTVPDGDDLSYAWDLDGDGYFDDATGISPQISFSDNGVFTVYLEVTDKRGIRDVAATTIFVSNVFPAIDEIEVSIDPVQVGTEINAHAFFTDPGTDEWTATWSWGDETTTEGTITQGSGFGSVSDTHTYTSAGVYTIALTISDDDGGVGESIYESMVVYNPDGGFISGGGWIDSPTGAYLPDSTLTGKISFSFVSKYKKGTTLPTGNTKFQFKVADLNFHSSSYDWLVVTGSDFARFKGTGTINGMGEYKFLIWAADGETDTFRIKIWEEDEFGVETVVYDNGFDQAIGGGSIVVHTGK